MDGYPPVLREDPRRQRQEDQNQGPSNFTEVKEVKTDADDPMRTETVMNPATVYSRPHTNQGPQSFGAGVHMNGQGIASNQDPDKQPRFNGKLENMMKAETKESLGPTVMRRPMANMMPMNAQMGSQFSGPTGMSNGGPSQPNDAPPTGFMKQEVVMPGANGMPSISPQLMRNRMMGDGIPNGFHPQNSVMGVPKISPGQPIGKLNVQMPVTMNGDPQKRPTLTPTNLAAMQRVARLNSENPSGPDAAHRGFLSPPILPQSLNPASSSGPTMINSVAGVKAEPNGEATFGSPQITQLSVQQSNQSNQSPQGSQQSTQYPFKPNIQPHMPFTSANVHAGSFPHSQPMSQQQHAQFVAHSLAAQQSHMHSFQAMEERKEIHRGDGVVSLMPNHIQGNQNSMSMLMPDRIMQSAQNDPRNLEQSMAYRMAKNLPMPLSNHPDAIRIGLQPVTIHTPDTTILSDISNIIDSSKASFDDLKRTGNANQNLLKKYSNAPMRTYQAAFVFPHSFQTGKDVNPEKEPPNESKKRKQELISGKPKAIPSDWMWAMPPFAGNMFQNMMANRIDIYRNDPSLTVDGTQVEEIQIGVKYGQKPLKVTYYSNPISARSPGEPAPYFYEGKSPFKIHTEDGFLSEYCYQPQRHDLKEGLSDIQSHVWLLGEIKADILYIKETHPDIAIHHSISNYVVEIHACSEKMNTIQLILTKSLREKSKSGWKFHFVDGSKQPINTESPLYERFVAMVERYRKEIRPYHTSRDFLHHYALLVELDYKEGIS